MKKGIGSSRPNPGPVRMAKAQNIRRRCQSVLARTVTAPSGQPGEQEQLHRIADKELVDREKG